MNNYSKVSDNTLNEAANLLNSLLSLIERDYLHVEDAINPSIKKAIKKEWEKVQKEFDKREIY
jgi:hypothetical protein